MKVLFFLLLASTITVSYSALQFARVTGKLLCGGVPVKPLDTNVTFWESDTLDPDDKFDTVHPDLGTGNFEIYMEESETHKIKPYLIITHKCNAKFPDCHRDSTFNVPGEYVHYKDKEPHGRPWNIGRLDLTPDAKDGDKRKCKEKH